MRSTVCPGQTSLFDPPKPDKPVCYKCGGQVSIADDDTHFECECDNCKIVFWERKSKYKPGE